MKDRVVQYPHRYQLVPVAGETNVYDFVPVPGTITEAGTPLNKATLLSDATATLYGLTGEDATVDGAFSKVTNIAQSASKLYGNVTFTDSISAGKNLIKNIAIGEGKKFGKLIMHHTLLMVNCGVLIEFTNDSTKTIVVGSSNSGNYLAGEAISRRQLGMVTGHSLSIPNGQSIGHMVTGSAAIYVKELYIDGENLKIIFSNSETSAQSLNCSIDWEVW